MNCALMLAVLPSHGSARRGVASNAMGAVCPMCCFLVAFGLSGAGRRRIGPRAVRLLQGGDCVALRSVHRRSSEAGVSRRRFIPDNV